MHSTYCALSVVVFSVPFIILHFLFSLLSEYSLVKTKHVKTIQRRKNKIKWMNEWAHNSLFTLLFWPKNVTWVFIVIQNHPRSKMCEKISPTILLYQNHAKRMTFYFHYGHTFVLARFSFFFFFALYLGKPDSNVGESAFWSICLQLNTKTNTQLQKN